jgi:hypothetical protein
VVEEFSGEAWKTEVPTTFEKRSIIQMIQAEQRKPTHAGE